MFNNPRNLSVSYLHINLIFKSILPPPQIDKSG
jgi:hypothetical protein